MISQTIAIPCPICGKSRVVNKSAAARARKTRCRLCFICSAEERFWGKVKPLENGCWDWQGAISNMGYGRFDDGGKDIYAHRYAYELFKGVIPKDMELDHLCRNSKCVNPDHLEAVTHRENILRGETFSSKEARITHCPKGHPYDLFNTYWRRDRTGRMCRACQKERLSYIRTHKKEICCTV